MAAPVIPDLLKKCVVVYSAAALVLFFASGIRVSGKADIPWLCAAFLLNLIFVSCKSGALFMLTKTLAPVSYPAVLKAFLKSVTLSTVTFTGKAGFFAALFANLGFCVPEKKKVAKILVAFAVMNFLAFITFSVFFLDLSFLMKGVWIALFLILSLALIRLLFRFPGSGAAFVFMVISYASNYLQIAVIARSVGADFSLELLRAVIAADLARVISQISFGLGAFDGVFYLFSDRFGILPALSLPIFLVLVRVFGEFLTSLWGLFLFMKEVFGKREQRPQAS